jgi:hypothetical protein
MPYLIQKLHENALRRIRFSGELHPIVLKKQTVSSSLFERMGSIFEISFSELAKGQIFRHPFFHVMKP